MNYNKKIAKLGKKITEHSEQIKEWESVLLTIEGLRPTCSIKRFDICKNCENADFCLYIDSEVAEVNLKKAKYLCKIKELEHKISLCKFKQVSNQR